MRSILMLIFIISCAGAPRTFLSGKGVSMTRVHLSADEELKDLKPIKAKFCVEPFKKSLNSSSDLISHVQKAYRADFIRDFELKEENVHPFKTCYHLTGIAARAVKVKPVISEK